MIVIYKPYNRVSAVALFTDIHVSWLYFRGTRYTYTLPGIIRLCKYWWVFSVYTCTRLIQPWRVSYTDLNSFPDRWRNLTGTAYLFCSCSNLDALVYTCMFMYLGCRLVLLFLTEKLFADVVVVLKIEFFLH